MSQNALSINGLRKQYRDFLLEDVSFDVPCGTIVGLIGENGAGKSTTIKAVLNLIQRDGGTVSFFGKQEADFETRNQIGVVFDDHNFPDTFTPKELSGLLKHIYPQWDEAQYYAFLGKLSLPVNKKIRTFSKGMKMKLSIAAAMSHHSRLLILDEATGGLDPVVRDDILDMLLEFVQDESHSILVSSHVTSDLEKIADYIVFLHNGRVVFSKPKDELKYRYGILRCGAAQFHLIDKSEIIAYRRQDYEWQVLVPDRHSAKKKYPDMVIDPATMDEIMLIYIKGVRQ